MNAAVFPSGVRAAKQINVEIKERGGNIQRCKTRGSFQFSGFQTRAWSKAVGKDFFPFLRKPNQWRKDRAGEILSGFLYFVRLGIGKQFLLLTSRLAPTFDVSQRKRSLVEIVTNPYHLRSLGIESQIDRGGEHDSITVNLAMDQTIPHVSTRSA